MKLFHETSIKFYSDKSHLKICVLSDLHFSYQVTDEKLDAILEKMSEREPDYILIPGDLIDSCDMLKDQKEENRLINFVKNLAKAAKVIISMGNHDTYRKTTKEFQNETGELWQNEDHPAYIDRLRELDNVVYLNNESYEDKNLYVFGFTQKPAYYNYKSKKKRVTIIHPAHEDLDELLREFDEIDRKYLINLPKNKLKLAMIHSPVYLDDFRVKAELEEFDYFISGHMHNGVVPPVLSELWPGKRGVVSPTHQLFPKNVRKSIKSADDKAIVAGAITTFHECVGNLSRFNALYPAYFMTLEFTNDTRFKRKPYVKKKYLNY